MDKEKMNYDNETLAEMFEKFAATSLGPTVVNSTTLHYYGDLKGKTIIEFGCGAGHFLKKCSAEGASFCLGLDINESMIISGGNKVMDEDEYMLKK